MRHVPIAEFKDKLSEIVAAAEAGEEIVITRHGREVVKLVAAGQDQGAQRRAALVGLIEMRESLRRSGVRVTQEELKSWKEEGRR